MSHPLRASRTPSPLPLPLSLQFPGGHLRERRPSFTGQADPDVAGRCGVGVSGGVGVRIVSAFEHDVKAPGARGIEWVDQSHESSPPPAGSSTGSGTLADPDEAPHRKSSLLSSSSSTYPPRSPSLSPSRDRASSDPTAIPWTRLTPLLLFAIAEATTFSVIFPLITDMLTSFTSPSVPPDRIGLYAGLGEGIMMLVEALCAPFWARAADRYGRRPCLVAGFGVTVVGMAGIGWARGVKWLVFFRSILGLNPCGVVVRLSAVEISNPANRARIFSVLSPSFSIGMLIGTFLGGELGRPFGRLPAWLGGERELWRDWPFALPCLVIGALDLAVLLNGWAFLDETRPPGYRAPEDADGDAQALDNRDDASDDETLAADERSDKAHRSRSRSRASTDEESTLSPPPSTTTPSPPPRPRATFRAALAVPSFLLLTSLFLLFQICTFSWDGFYTVYTYTPTPLGGLGLPISTIGLLYAVSYAGSFLLNPLLLPRFTRWWGAETTLSRTLLCWIGLGVCVPFSQWGAARGGWAGGAVMWSVLGVQVVLRALGTFGWALCDVLTLSCFDAHPELMATSSAISLIVGAGGRALGPAISGWVFSLATQAPAGSWARQTPWMYLIGISVPAVVLARVVPNKRTGVDSVSNPGSDSGSLRLADDARAQAQGEDDIEDEEDERIPMLPRHADAADTRV